MSLLNRGGLTLVNSHFFEWGKRVLSSIRNAFDVDDMERDPKHAFQTSKKKILGDVQLRHEFIQLCKSLSLCAEKSAEVYSVILQKTVHARFAVVFRACRSKPIKEEGVVSEF